MNRKRGFMATSLIYSFFLVFLMLMMAILTDNANHRILLSSLKEDIRSSFQEEQGFVVDFLENRSYSTGEVVSFGNESWQVIRDTGSSLVLVLQRSLTKVEIESALGRPSSNSQYFGTCNDTSCMVRACRSFTGGQEYCYIYSTNTRLHSKPVWLPTVLQSQTENFGRTIVSRVVEAWFYKHQGLQQVLSKDKLISQSFSDGYFTYPQSGQDPIYVRIPLSLELSSVSSWYGGVAFHLLDSVGTSNELQTKIYNGSLRNVLSNTTAVIRPVIEAKKGV